MTGWEAYGIFLYNKGTESDKNLALMLLWDYLHILEILREKIRETHEYTPRGKDYREFFIRVDSEDEMEMIHEWFINDEYYFDPEPSELVIRMLKENEEARNKVKEYLENE